MRDAPRSPADLVCCAAVAAWRRLHAAPVDPECVEILKGPHEKKTVCRIANAAPSGSGVIAKRYRLAKGLVEQTIYEEVLPRLPAPTLRCYGLVAEPDGTHCWLFLEDAGESRYSALPAELRGRLAAEWLGVLHTSATRVPPSVNLPDRGPGYYLNCLTQVREALRDGRGNPALTVDDRALLDLVDAECDLLAARWDRVWRLCAEMPRVVVHGDFVAKNLRVRESGAGLALLPFDWASGGWGFPAVDLARSPFPSDRFAADHDAAAYHAVAREHWPALDATTVGLWADIGSVFRSLAAMCWHTRALASDQVERPVAALRFYEVTIAHAARAAGCVD